MYYLSFLSQRYEKGDEISVALLLNLVDKLWCYEWEKKFGNF